MLLQWQEFMNDHARAALTCIKLYVESPEVDRDHYLDQSMVRASLLLTLNKIFVFSIIFLTN